MVEFKKGDMVLVTHTRKGTFIGIVKEEFNDVTDEWAKIIVDGDEIIQGGLIK